MQLKLFAQNNANQDNRETINYGLTTYADTGGY